VNDTILDFSPFLYEENKLNLLDSDCFTNNTMSESTPQTPAFCAQMIKQDCEQASLLKQTKLHSIDSASEQPNRSIFSPLRDPDLFLPKVDDVLVLEPQIELKSY